MPRKNKFGNINPVSLIFITVGIIITAIMLFVVYKVMTKTPEVPSEPEIESIAIESEPINEPINEPIAAVERVAGVTVMSPPSMPAVERVAGATVMSPPSMPVIPPSQISRSCNDKAALDTLNGSLKWTIVDKFWAANWPASSCNPNINYSTAGLSVNGGPYIFKGSDMGNRINAYKAAVDTINNQNQWDKNPDLHIKYLV